jgi:hypothetical protein
MNDRGAATRIAEMLDVIAYQRGDNVKSEPGKAVLGSIGNILRVESAGKPRHRPKEQE